MHFFIFIEKKSYLCFWEIPIPTALAVSQLAEELLFDNKVLVQIQYLDKIVFLLV